MNALQGTDPRVFEPPVSSLRFRLDTRISKNYALDQFAVVAHRAQFNLRSLGRLGDPKERAQGGNCGRKLIPMCATVKRDTILTAGT
jgi:hypothetical protein